MSTGVYGIDQFWVDTAANYLFISTDWFEWADKLARTDHEDADAALMKCQEAVDAIIPEILQAWKLGAIRRLEEPLFTAEEFKDFKEENISLAIH